MSKTEIISLRYCYSPKKVSNICKYLFRTKPTIGDTIEKMKTIFSEKQLQSVPNYKYRIGESHVPKAKRGSNLPSGFYPSEKKNKVWLRTLEHHVSKNPYFKEKVVSRYYFHFEKRNAGIKYLKASRKRVVANKFKKTITVYLEVSSNEK